MANWIRSPKQRWFVNTNWVQYAFEAAKTNSTQWNSYYGSNKYIFNSQGLNPDNPNYLPLLGSNCGLCEIIQNCGWSNIKPYLCSMASVVPSSTDNSGCDNCGMCFTDCDESGSICETISQANCQLASLPCNYTCPDVEPEPGGLCSILACEYYNTGENLWIGYDGTFVSPDDENAMCDPCGDGCDDFTPCPCGTPTNPEAGECSFLPPGDICPAVCCAVGEPGCVDCNGDGNWVPADLCCSTCGNGCAPYGYPMPESFCQSCEYCNSFPDAPHCINCCRCSPTGPLIDCDDVDELCNNPTECADFSANCYECNGSYIPIWFECEEVDPCPNPFNPDCETGEEIVCYDYNTNDPIYYNASNLGASVIIEHDNPVAGSSYSYGNVATLCEIPDSLQLCVYGVASNGTKTQLVYETDFTINEQTAQVTLAGTLNVSGYSKIRFERCSDDKKMFLTFSEGSKLSATDINASLHQLLFLIQEKEFASNTYYQVANDDGAGGALFTVSPPTSLPVNFNLSTTNQNDVLAWDGNGSFVGQDPSVVAGNIQLDNLSNVNLTTVSLDDFLYYDGSNWINTDFSDKVQSVLNVVDFKDWVSYDSSADGKLDGYYHLGCDTAVNALWARSDSCVLGNIPKDFVPNALTAFGLGYSAAKVQINDQVQSDTSDIGAYVTTKISQTLQSGGTILSNLRWEIGRSEGRDISGITNYPVAYFDIPEFATLNHGTADVLDDEANPPLTTGTGLAYYQAWAGAADPAALCSTCRNKLYVENIDTFKYKEDKSRSSGLGPNNTSGLPTYDNYLLALRSVITKREWGTALGYTETHPLQDYPNTNNTTASPASYTDYMGSDDLIYGNYTYSGNTGATKNVPAVVTYYLAQLWDKSSGAPSWLVWDGNIDMAGKIDASGIPAEATTELGANGKYWYYWRWWISGFDSNTTGSASNPGAYDTLSYYSPFDPTKLQYDGNVGDAGKYTILPASEDFDGINANWDGADFRTDADDVSMAKGGSNSLKIDANKVFSNLSMYLGDMYDEYVFKVELDAAARITTSNCPDANCYEVVAHIEKYTDGCDPGDVTCSQIGSGGSNTGGVGYHVYPTDFDDNVVRVWESYPYEKLHTEIRNKTGSSYELVLKVPRLKRIGYIDVWKDPNDADGMYRQLALDFITDYNADHWDSTTDIVPERNSTTHTKNQPPELQDMDPNHGNADGGSAMAFNVESAIQFIRLGIPANIRVSCYTVSTPQSNVFSG